MKAKTLFVGGMMMIAIAGLASPAAADGAQVWVKKDEGTCGLLDSNGNGVLGELRQQVVTPSGNAKLTCKASQDPIADPVRWDFDNTGIGCGTDIGITTNWFNVIDTDGTITLQCFVKANQA